MHPPPIVVAGLTTDLSRPYGLTSTE